MKGIRFRIGFGAVSLTNPGHILGHVSLQRLEPIQHEYESVAYLSNTLPGNFYHWLLLTVPMLRFYQAAGVDLDRFYVGEPLSDWQRRSLPP